MLVIICYNCFTCIVSLSIATIHPQDVKFHKLLLTLDPSLKDFRGIM